MEQPPVIRLLHAHHLLAVFKSGLKCRPGPLEEASIPSIRLASRIVWEVGEEQTCSLTLFVWGTYYFWKIQRCERRTKLLISMSFLLGRWCHWKGLLIIGRQSPNVSRRGMIFFLYLTAYSSPISAFCCFLHRIFSGFQHLSHSRKIWSGGVPSSLLSISRSGGGATFLKLGDKLVTLTLHSPHRLTGALDFQFDCYCVKI